MTTIKLQSSDGKIFKVDIEVAKKSQTIKTMLEYLKPDENMDEVVPIVKVRADILNRVLQWSEHHVKDSLEDDATMTSVSPVIPERYLWPLPTDDISEWDKEFMAVDMGTAFEIILAANFLDVKDLLDLASKSVANRIKGKSVDEICTIFNVTPPKETPKSDNGEGGSGGKSADEMRKISNVTPPKETPKSDDGEGCSGWFINV